MGTQLAKLSQMLPATFDEAVQVAEMFAKSGMFKDAQDAAKCVVRIMAGAELGFGPFASMQGIHIIDGKPSLAANLIAACIKRHPHYDYRVKRIDEEGCIIAFYQDKELLGESSLTMEEAIRLGLTVNYDKYKNEWKEKTNWTKFPRNMLFARALSNGARWYTPDVFGGMPVYTPDELDIEVAEDGDIIDILPNETESPRPPLRQAGSPLSNLVVLKESIMGHYQRVLGITSPDAIKQRLASHFKAAHGKPIEEATEAELQAVLESIARKPDYVAPLKTEVIV